MKWVKDDPLSKKSLLVCKKFDNLIIKGSKKAIGIRVSQMGSTGGGGQFGQNGQKLYENYKISILGSKQRGDMGGKPSFRVVGGDPPQSPPVPPLGETLGISAYVYL